MVESDVQTGAMSRKLAAQDAAGDARSFYDLSIIGLVLLVPLIVTELWFATYDSYYLRRHFTVEFGSRFTGNVYTATVHCPQSSAGYTPMFRAWNDADATAFLEDRHTGCHVSDVVSGGKVYRKRIWRGN